MGSLPCQNLAILASCITMAMATGFFEYGSRMAGDELAFEYRGQIPIFRNEYRLSVRASSGMTPSLRAQTIGNHFSGCISFEADLAARF